MSNIGNNKKNGNDDEAQKGNLSRHPHHSSSMDSSVFKFKNVNEVTGTIKSGHVLAIMGPSGAGKLWLCV